MTIKVPKGYLTRPIASKSYNRSKRALERDLEDAYVPGDEDVLAAFQLVTNDGVRRKADKVTTALVEQLKKDGKNPTWFVSESWLASKYGRKGNAKPDHLDNTDQDIDPRSTRTRVQKSDGKAPDDRNRHGASKHADNDGVYLPDDIEFLKERIRILEREKKEQQERNEKREAKLFAQLEVKDKQISAWDEVTQGLTKALATGQLTPTLLPGSTGQGGTREANAVNAEKRESVKSNKSSVVDAEVEIVEQQPAASKTAKTKAQRKGTKRKHPAPKEKKATAKKKTKQPKWYETPTLNRFLSRKK